MRCLINVKSHIDIQLVLLQAEFFNVVEGEDIVRQIKEKISVCIPSI